MRWSENGLTMCDGILYRHNSDADSQCPQLVIPADLCSAIVCEFHDSARDGNYGADKILSKILKWKHGSFILRDSENRFPSISKGILDVNDTRL